MTRARLATLAIVVTLAATSMPVVALEPRDDSETVMITFRPKAGAEADLAKVIANHWATVRRLDLVLPTPHVTLRATDERGRAYFVDIFTWRSAEVPDHAPADIQAIWGEMTRLTESREGKPGLDIVEMRLVAGGQPSVF